MKHKFSSIILIWLSMIYLAAADYRILQNFCTLQSDMESMTKFYDLRSLSLKSGYHKIVNGSDTFFINICTASNDFKMEGDNSSVCSKRTSICLVNDKNPKGISLGDNRGSKLILDKQSLNPHMIYDDVALDADKPKTIDPRCEKVNSFIKFVCNKTRALENKPTFNGMANNTNGECTFQFEWQTSEACADEHTLIEPHYGNESLVFLIGTEKMDLDKIIRPQMLRVKYDNNEEYDFVIKKEEYFKGNFSNKSSNIYNTNLTACDGSLVCQLKTDRKFVRSIGEFTNAILKHANESFHLISSSQSVCGRAKNKTTAVVFNLYCNETLNDNATKIEFKAENNLCHYVFDVFSKQICYYEKLIQEGQTATPTATKPSTIKSTTSTTPATPVTSEKPNIDQKSKTDDKKPKVEESKQQENKKDDDSKTSAENPKTSSSQSKNEGSSNTKVFGFIILVIVSVVGIVLAIISLINDDRRSWLQKHLRRIKPQHTTSFHYSQLSTNNVHLMNNQQENLNSVYAPTVMPKSVQFNETVSNKQSATNSHNPHYNLRDNSYNVKTSIREQLDKLRLMNDNDLGVSRNDFNSISFKGRSSSKDESELNLLT